jgi:FkbH-like protein
LGLLADRGILVAAASKNEPAVVKQALERSDLLLSPERIFPLEVHWEPKSQSIARILRTWNIAADSVIFVDDSPMELAEVEAAHPGIKAVLFPAGDYVSGLKFLRQLRDSCGKEHVSAEDLLRMSSIQGNVEWNTGIAEANAETFLEQACAVIEFDFDCAEQPRVLELINKTNQFNLNGKRYTPSEWRQASSQPGAFVLSVAYKDKFGDLGTISALLGRRNGHSLVIDVWVMSCRAFSRRIEHKCIDTLFTELNASDIEFNFAPSQRNEPVRRFFSAMTGKAPDREFRMTKAQFADVCPPLYQQVNHKPRMQTHG